MAEPSPAYLWYPKDVISSGRVAALSALEELWYRRALDQSWLHDGMPADPEEFAGWVGRGCTRESAAKIIEKFFEPHRKHAGKVVNPRQEKERKLFEKKRKQKSEAGKLGMAKRWKQKGNSHNSVITEDNISIAIPISISKEEKTTTTAAATTRKLTDAEWLEGLQKSTAYKRIEVLNEYERARVWAETNNRQCTRRFFVNWLNRARPIDVNANGTNKPNGHKTKRTDAEVFAESADFYSNYPA